MGTLGKHQIIEFIKQGKLIINAFRKDGEYEVEPASYDLRAGIIIWKESNPVTRETTLERRDYKRTKSDVDQDTVHLHPGQVMFVITKEEVNLPANICGTVYAKNKFSRDGILALTTGHIDPGIRCPIVIRLINLRSIPYTFRLGEPIYTIVFHTIETHLGETLEVHPPITMEKTIANTLTSADAALANALNELSLTDNFIRKDEFEKLKDKAEKLMIKDEFGKILKSYIVKSIWGVLLIVFAVIGAIGSIVKIVEFAQKPSANQTTQKNK